jgi:hypothetical protein
VVVGVGAVEEEEVAMGSLTHEHVRVVEDVPLVYVHVAGAMKVTSSHSQLQEMFQLQPALVLLSRTHSLEGPRQ